MSLILHYPLNQSDPLVATVGTSPTQSNVSPVTSITDATYGTVAFFDANISALETPAPASIISDNARTFSVWANRDNENFGYVISLGVSSDFRRLETFFFPGSSVFGTTWGNSLISQVDITDRFTSGVWVHCTITYDGTTLSHYIDGVLEASVNVALDTAISTLAIGNTNRSTSTAFEGRLTDFRVYDGALDASTISQLFADGPNDANASALTLTPFTHLIDLDWDVIPGASTYHVRYTVDSGAEQDLIVTTDRSYIFYNTVPGSSYEFKLFTDLDLVTPFSTETTVTPSIDVTNIGALMIRLGNDLTILSRDSLNQFQSQLSDVFNTGDIVNTSVGSTRFVADSGTITLPDVSRELIFTPFDPLSGSGQTVNIVLPDTSTVSVSYDETENEIDVSGTTYAIGESFVSGGLKVTPKDI